MIRIPDKCSMCESDYIQPVDSVKHFRFAPSVCSNKCFVKLITKNKKWNEDELPEILIKKTVEELNNPVYKSLYELKFSYFLTDNRVDFLYEPYTFKISDSKSYTPDFFIIKSGTFIEVKGLWNGSAYQKFKRFRTFAKGFFNVFLIDKCGLKFLGVKI